MRGRQYASGAIAVILAMVAAAVAASLVTSLSRADTGSGGDLAPIELDAPPSADTTSPTNVIEVVPPPVRFDTTTVPPTAPAPQPPPGPAPTPPGAAGRPPHDDGDDGDDGDDDDGDDDDDLEEDDD